MLHLSNENRRIPVFLLLTGISAISAAPLAWCGSLTVTQQLAFGKIGVGSHGYRRVTIYEGSAPEIKCENVLCPGSGWSQGQVTILGKPDFVVGILMYEPVTQNTTITVKRPVSGQAVGSLTPRYPAQVQLDGNGKASIDFGGILDFTTTSTEKGSFSADMIIEINYI